jgi:hypothetical protein
MAFWYTSFPLILTKAPFSEMKAILSLIGAKKESRLRYCLPLATQK